MSQKQIILLFSALIALIIAAFVLRAIELEDATVRIERFPKSGPMFSSRSLELTDFEKDMLGRVDTFLIQFHEWHPNARKRRIAIQQALSRTHTLEWNYDFVWEKWVRK